MSIISKLDELIANPYKITNRIGGKIRLVEDKESSFPATIIKNSSKLLLCKFDEDKSLLHFFSNKENVKTMSDYVCFIEHNKQLFVFIIELSTTKPKTYQFEPTKLFSEYVNNTCKRVFNTEFEISYKSILIIKKV